MEPDSRRTDRAHQLFGTQIDFLASYRLTRGLDLVAEGANFTDAPLSLYQGTPGRNFQYEVYGRTFAFGLKGRF